MNNKEKYERLVCDANDEIRKFLNFFKENSEVFKRQTLKLYDVVEYYGELEKDYPLLAQKEKEDNQLSYFLMFCNDYYEEFVLECSNNGIDFEKLQIEDSQGRNGFYLSKIRINNRWNWDESDADYEFLYNIYELLEGHYGNFYGIDLNEKGFINDYIDDIEDDEDYEEYINSLEEIIKYFYDDAVRYFKPSIDCYAIIEKYKQNQVKAFKKYLDFYLEDVEN